MILNSFFSFTKIFLADKSPLDQRMVGLTFSIQDEIKGNTSFSEFENQFLKKTYFLK